MNEKILLAIAFLLLALEHFGAQIPGWLTGIVLIIIALLLFGVV